MWTSWRKTWQERRGSELHCCESTECNECQLYKKLKPQHQTWKLRLLELRDDERWEYSREVGVSPSLLINTRGVSPCVHVASFSCCLESLWTTAAPWAYLSSEMHSHLHGAGNWEHVQKNNIVGIADLFRLVGVELTAGSHQPPTPTNCKCSDCNNSVVSPGS